LSHTDRLCVDTIRMLSIDQVERAASGHPGMPLGAAPMAYVLWDRYLRHNPGNPLWPDRDRFILSAGHGSALLYSLLHVYGYAVSMADLERFRQWGSRTPGHPERGLTPGVEVSTGPLGQGFAMGVGMALAERHLAQRFNRPGHTIVDHYTYAIVSDGDLEEGVSAEAASFAGTQRLGKLIYLYDSNGISIEGPTATTFTEDVLARFRAYGWHTVLVEDGEDLEAIAQALDEARAVTDRPSLIEVRTHIGYRSPKQDTREAHGEALGREAYEATRAAYGWSQPPFSVPEEAARHFATARQRGAALEAEWRERFEAYRKAYPELAQAFAATVVEGRLPDGWADRLPRFAGGGAMATRDASGQALNALAAVIPNLLGGSADLAPSTKTWIQGEAVLGPSGGRNIAFGVREHAMAAIVNGLAAHGGIRPYGSTFLVFSDYCRPAIRLAALMGLPSLFVFSHDSLGVGEDGPTHQPIEHVMSLRAIPGLVVYRPADANETVAAWREVLADGRPAALVLTRQKVPVLDPDRVPADGVARGAYILEEAPEGDPEVILIATGSEVHLALGAAAELRARGRRPRVVSMPSWERFLEQPAAYREAVLPRSIRARVAVEAGVSLGWERFVGEDGAIVAVDRFGASAPGGVVLEAYGFTVARVVEEALRVLGARPEAASVRPEGERA
jgi:transketolase